MEKNERRFKLIFQEIIKEFKKELEENEKNENYIKEMINDILNKSINLVKTNCKEDLEWFQKNGKVSIENDNFNFKVESVEVGDDLNFHVREFEECANKYKLNNFDEDIKKINSQSQELEKSHLACMSGCMKNSIQMNDKDIRICFSKCFKVTTEKSKIVNNQYLEIIKSKVDQINNLL